MSYDPKNIYAQGYAGTREIDAGLQAHMRSVFNTMGRGLVATGLVAFAVANIPAVYNAVFGTPLAWVAIFAPLAWIWFGFSPQRVWRMPVAKVRLNFYLFSAMMGLSLASVFVVFTEESIARVFFIAASMFAATSLYGYTTKRDLTGVGSFLFMGLIGIFIAALVNLFMQSPMIQFVISTAGVVVFTGLAAWDVQRIKESYAEAHGTEGNAKAAVIGALSMYLNFVNLFQVLLHFLGNRN